MLFGSDELTEALLQVEVVSPDGVDGSILSTNGGLLAVDGLRLLAAPGTVGSPQVARLRSLEFTNVADLLNPSLELVAAFELIIGRLDPGKRLVLQTSGLSSSNYFVLARILAREEVVGLEPVERLWSDGSGSLINSANAGTTAVCVSVSSFRNVGTER